MPFKSALVSRTVKSCHTITCCIICNVGFVSYLIKYGPTISHVVSYSVVPILVGIDTKLSIVDCPAGFVPQFVWLRKLRVPNPQCTTACCTQSWGNLKNDQQQNSGPDLGSDFWGFKNLCAKLKTENPFVEKVGQNPPPLKHDVCFRFHVYSLPSSILNLFRSQGFGWIRIFVPPPLCNANEVFLFSEWKFHPRFTSYLYSQKSIHMSHQKTLHYISFY